MKPKSGVTEKEKILLNIISEILWMAIRYAHGRHTYAPGVIRDVVNLLKKHFPEYELRKDGTIEPPTLEQLNSVGEFRGDWLDDLLPK